MTTHAQIRRQYNIYSNTITHLTNLITYSYLCPNKDLPFGTTILAMNRNLLYYIAAILWGIPGGIITVKGIRAYMTMPSRKLWWLLLITAFVLAAFFLMFRKVTDKYSARISSLPGKTSLWQTFPLRGWILIIFMSCLGIALKFIPNLPAEFTASFYSGLGPMLLFAACLFIFNSFRMKRR